MIHKAEEGFEPEVRLEAVKRECYVCVYCEMVYADSPVTQCDCLGEIGNPRPHFYKGKIGYEKRIEK